MGNSTPLNYSLCEHVIFVRGACNSLLIDCNNMKLFQLDREAADFLNELIQGKRSLNTPNDLLQKEKDILDYLKEKRLISHNHTISSTTTETMAKQTTLDSVWFELRKSCNLRCVHCYDASNPTADNVSEVMSLEQWQNITCQLVPYKPHKIVLIGGEPLLYSYVAELIAFIRQTLPHTELVLYSNLTLLSSVLINVLKHNKIKVASSLYSYKSETHDSITQIPGSWDKTVKNIRALKAADIDVHANMVVMQLNQDEVEETKNFIKELTGHSTKADPIRCVCDGLEKLLPSKMKNAHRITSSDCFHDLSYEAVVRAMRGNSCWQGKLNISWNGFVSPCIMWQSDVKGPNLKTFPLSKVLDEYLLPVFWRQSRDKVKPCCVCEFRYVCWDCRPLARSMTERGTICDYDPYTGQWEGHS